MRKELKERGCSRLFESYSRRNFIEKGRRNGDEIDCLSSRTKRTGGR